MMDVYPTLLEILGYRLADNRANLGVSLLSARSTLAEELGADILTEALDGNAGVSRFLWNDVGEALAER